ncbi:nitrogen assimilation regulatory protein [Cyanobacterium stanieri PCC 7202]|uniref:Nitrogen assimilation regulatory protein n=1 Tax=Cyanobacterium stanieri (strain ATCC 29140 / PCC 7202) TaxID=292563 RepID=K9YI00_CYASC|nr:nitrogen assimilation regulatory protein [Cyanobacterium stanieri PCC 7202]
MEMTELVTWLKERTAMNILPDEVLRAIAPNLTSISWAKDKTIIEASQPIKNVYILESGQVEIKGTKQTSCLLAGSLINLRELILEQSAQNTITTITEAKLWAIPAEKFTQLIKQYPEISQAFSQQLAQEIANLSSQLDFEQERRETLRPYLVNKAKRGIIGKSRYAVRLRQNVKTASKDHESVLIFGEQGLEKDNLAALIHYGSGDRREPVVKVDCAKLQASGAEIFGRAGGKPGLIEAVGEGTLIFNNIQDLPSELLPRIVQLLESNTYTPVNRGQSIFNSEKECKARLIFIAEKVIPEIKKLITHDIKVPPLRVRKSDIEDQVNYYISLICRNKKINKPQITAEALRRLQSYDFPNNLRELQNLIERAIVQMAGTNELTEEIIWPSQSKKQQFRFNLLTAYPRFRHFLRSPWWPDRINYGFTLTVFALVVIILFVGPQTRDQNFALNLFWAWWWPLILVAFPFVGRLWCSVCPFMIYGEVTQKLTQTLFPNYQLKKWPRKTAEKWGGWFLFTGFALILLWEELWDLPNTAYLSSCLLLLITAGAMICSAIFERRFWCRYLCPIGGMNGMFAKLAMTELRAQQGTCSAECNTYQCYKGGPEKGEGQETNGCPLYSHPAQMQDNRDCVLCMTCLKACPHRSVTFNLRPPAVELWTTHQPRSYEVALLFLLLNAVFLHLTPQINDYFHLGLDLDNFWIHGLSAIALITIPAIIPLTAHGVIRLVCKLNHTQSRSFIELAYGYLPLVLTASLAYYLQMGLGEAGRVLPLFATTFGLDGSGLPIWVAHPAVIAFLQGLTIIFGVLLTVILSQKIARQSFKLLLPQHLSTLSLAIFFWQLIF